MYKANGKKFEPYWNDACGHYKNSFIGTILMNEGPHDVYVYIDEGGNPSSCVRYGNDPEQYMSGFARYAARHVTTEDMELDPAEYLILYRLEKFRNELRQTGFNSEDYKEP